MDEKTRATSIGAYEAKTKFSEIISRAETGESFVITKNGRPVARITPFENFDRERARQAGERIQQLAETIDLEGVTWEQIKAWRDEGRP